MKLWDSLRRAALAGLLIALAGIACVQPSEAADPLKIGFSMALTGGLAANGKAALLAIKLWAEDVNAKGGLLGRNVTLDYYDDQSTPSNVPGIYTKLISVDKVDLLISPYGTNMIAPSMPVVMQSGKTMMSLFGVGVNDQFHYDRYFQIMPLGPNSGAAIPTGFFDVAMKLDPKPRSVALVGADAEFGKVTTDAARVIAKQLGLKIVYDRSYPPNTMEFSSILRSVQATKPDIVFVAAYPTDGTGLVRAAHEIGLKTELFGGGMAGSQYAAIKTQLGPLLNRFISYETYVPSEKMQYPEVEAFLKRYRAEAATQGVDALGYYVPPFIYAAMQIVGEAVTKTGSLDQKLLAETMHKTSFDTILGPISFAPDGEWAKSRILIVQYQGIKNNDLDQFLKVGTQTILYPDDLAAGKIETPFQADH